MGGLFFVANLELLKYEQVYNLVNCSYSKLCHTVFLIPNDHSVLCGEVYIANIKKHIL